MTLTKRQSYIISQLKDGVVLELNIGEGNRANKYYLGNGIKPIQRRPVVDLHDMGIIKLVHVNYRTQHFQLTELGKTIEI